MKVNIRRGKVPLNRFGASVELGASGKVKLPKPQHAVSGNLRLTEDLYFRITEGGDFRALEN